MCSYSVSVGVRSEQFFSLPFFGGNQKAFHNLSVTFLTQIEFMAQTVLRSEKAEIMFYMDAFLIEKSIFYQ